MLRSTGCSSCNWGKQTFSASFPVPFKADAAHSPPLPWGKFMTSEMISQYFVSWFSIPLSYSRDTILWAYGDLRCCPAQSRYFGTDDGEGKEPNPYELVAAAQAACFSMALARELAGAGFTPQRIETTVTVTLESLPVGWTITGVQLEVLAEVARLKQNDFIQAAVGAKTRCTISRLLKANLSMSKAGKLRKSQNTQITASHG
jgi:osmotically inducible protein OsmC